MNTCSSSTVLRRELQILKLVAHKNTDKEVANKLFISTHIVISHRKNLMIKLNIKNTAGMIRGGFELGLLRV